VIMNRFDQTEFYISEFDVLWKGLSDSEKENFREIEGYIYHVKGTLNSFKSEHHKVLGDLENSLQIQNSVQNSMEIASTLNNISFTHILLGEYDKGLNYAKQLMSFAEERDNKVNLCRAYEIFGILEELKGEYDLALEYHTMALNIANELNLQVSYANSMSRIALIYYFQGKYELAFKNHAKALVVLEDLNLDHFKAETIFGLIKACLKLALGKQTDSYMRKLNKLYDSNPIRGIKLFKMFSQALILKNNTRSKDKITAQKLFEEIIDESEDVGISSTAILHLSELLLDELKMYGSEEVLKEIDNKTRQLYELAQEHKLFPLIIEVLILRSKLAFLKLEVDEASKILNQANLIAEERGLKNLTNLIEKESRKLENEIALAAEITKRASSLQDRIDKAQIIEYIEKMQHLIKTTH
ncbi:MAG: tetratricopeptide repeat protein, partial [Candidatus Kariarchaeaceae archaeon]